MQLVIVRNKEEIELFLRRNVPLHIYELGDLDDFYFPHTTWYTMREGTQVRALLMLYAAETPPVLLALCEAEEVPLQGELMRSIFHLLPTRFYAHITPRMEEALSQGYGITHTETNVRMFLKDARPLEAIDTSFVFRLPMGEVRGLLDFYELSYPGHNFSPRMLKPDMYWGVKEDGTVVSVAGVHVYSQSYGVAALGNIATHPRFRKRGLGMAVTAKLCKVLLGSVESIGLNVRANNAEAINIYKRLGFSREVEFNQYDAKRRQ
jgi:ribosomal protein S18 acetylase RimI-like enzyme